MPEKKSTGKAITNDTTRDLWPDLDRDGDKEGSGTEVGSATEHSKRKIPINTVLPVESGQNKAVESEQNKKPKTVIETCCCGGVSGADGCKKLPNIQNQGFVHYCARTNKRIFGSLCWQGSDVEGFDAYYVLRFLTY